MDITIRINSSTDLDAALARIEEDWDLPRDSLEYDDLLQILQVRAQEEAERVLRALLDDRQERTEGAGLDVEMEYEARLRQAKRRATTDATAAAR